MNGAADEGPFYEGQNAFARGEQRTACPDTLPEHIREEWISGWREAKRYSDVAKMIEAACDGSYRLDTARERIEPIAQGDASGWW